jgi:hypothetical protein
MPEKDHVSANNTKLNYDIPRNMYEYRIDKYLDV